MTVAVPVVNWNSDSLLLSGMCADKLLDLWPDGALAGKVSGAGGGGFMMFFVPPEKRMDVVRALSRFEGQVSNCHFTKYGSQAWRV